jgi:hypothetical protein
MRIKTWKLFTQRCAILKELGLKEAGLYRQGAGLAAGGRFFRHIPSGVAPLRASAPGAPTYYAPCIDSSQVLAMYRKAVAELCRQCTHRMV